MEKFKIKYVVPFLAIQMIFYPASVRSSVRNHNITELHFIEQDFMKGLSSYINTMKENLIEYEDIISQAKQDISNQIQNGRKDSLGNPISVFCLVKRFSEGWGKLARFIREDDPTTGMKHIMRLKVTAMPAQGNRISSLMPALNCVL